MKLSILPEILAVCRFAPDTLSNEDLSTLPFYSITKTLEELSIVLPESHIPQGCKVESGWKAIRVDGVLDFSLTGILTSLGNPLADAGISIFAISTFDTDYILIKSENLNSAIRLLSDAGHQINKRSNP
jgi:uncharacterized protein